MDSQSESTTTSVRANPLKGVGGLARLRLALGYSLAGLRYAVSHEASIRDELIAFGILAPIAVLLPVSNVEHLLLLLALLMVILVELLNSAIEATVDRISFELHPLAGHAKDMGSTAVSVSLLIWLVTWAMIVGPVVRSWFGRQVP